MNLPQNGRVVVIDDKPDEALPLIEALSKQNIPLSYFNPVNDNFPDIPLSGVRVIFLDINLQEHQGHVENKTKASTAAAAVKKIIGNAKNPYILLIWAKHDDFDILEHLQKYLKFNPPLFIGSLQKNDCKEAGYPLDLILNNISNKLDDVSFFHILTMWENLVHQSAARTIQYLSNHSDGSDSSNDDDSIVDINKKNWNNELGSLFYALAKANTGINIDKMKDIDIIKNSILPFNSTFIDFLESNLNVYDNMEIIEKISFHTCDKRLDEKLKAEINSKLLLNQVDGSCLSIPGNIYKIEKSDEICNIDIHDILNQNCLKTDELLKEIVYVLLEVSPSCDYSNKKWKVNRVVLGLLVPQKYSKFIKKADFLYSSPLLNCQIGEIKENYNLILDLRYFTSVKFNYLEEKRPLYRIKHQFLVDIQQKISTHISRPGILSL